MAATKALELMETADATRNDEQNLIVALRIRPMSEDEIIQGATPIAHKVDKNMVVLMDPMDDQSDILRVNRSREKQYMFDFAFDGTTVQEEVYERTSQFLISNVMRGFNATVFAYGATGTGKTHTMLGNPDEHGIMSRALNDLFLEVDKTVNSMKHEITMSYLEIYNEMIRDLLNPGSGYLDLREDAKGVQVTGLTTLSTRNLQQFSEILRRGNKERTQEPTAANKTSSRSHAVLQLTVRQKNSHVSGTHQEVRMGKLFLIDLAGSERAANTHNHGKRMVEGAHINRSLLALGNCINALSDKSGSRYVNYRDSKLTRLLKDALGGNCRTVMIAHISPASIHFEESRNTLVYADRAKRIKTKVRKNVLDVSYHVSQYVHLINELVQENRRLRGRMEENGTQNPNSSALQAIQSEILHSGTRHRNNSLTSIKEELLTIFKDQMEFRHSLMDLNNTAMQISIEKTRNQLLIQKWEREKAIRRRNEQLHDEKWSKSSDNLSTELVSIGDSSIEPNEVTLARDDLLSLEQEQEQTDALRTSFQKELQHAKEKAARVQELLPNYVTTEDHQEIVSLLIKVHELEIEKLEMQSSCVQRDYEIQRREMVITVQNEHKSLCEKIIEKQKDLIDQHAITYPKELEELYTLYLQELNNQMLKENFLPPLPSYKTPSMTSLEMTRVGAEGESSTTEKLSAVNEEARRTVFSLPASGQPILQRQNSQQKDKIFSHSPKAQQMRQAYKITNNPTTQHVRQKSVVTLSSHSESPVPRPAAKVNVRKSDNKVLIQTNTRSIAAVAAQKKRRSRVPLDNNNNKFSPLAESADNYLSASRLAYHDNKFPVGSDVTLRQLLGEDMLSVGATLPAHPADDSRVLKHGQGRYKKSVKKQTDGSTMAKSRHGGSHYDGGGSLYQLTPEAFFKQLSKTTPRRGALEQSSYTSIADNRPLYRNRSQVSQPHKSNTHSHADSVFDDDMRHLEMAPTPNSTTVHQSGTDKGRGLTLQKKVKDNSLSNTPQPHGQHKGTVKKGSIPVPSKPQREINITGFSLQR